MLKIYSLNQKKMNIKIYQNVIYAIRDESPSVSIENFEENEEFYLSKCEEEKWLKTPINKISKTLSPNIITIKVD